MSVIKRVVDTFVEPISDSDVPPNLAEHWIPEQLTDGANPFRVLDRVLFAAGITACGLTHAREFQVVKLGRKLRTEAVGGHDWCHWEDEAPGRAALQQRFLEIVGERWGRALREARLLAAATRIPFEVYDPLLKSAEMKYGKLCAWLRGIRIDEEIDWFDEVNGRLLELADSTTPLDNRNSELRPPRPPGKPLKRRGPPSIQPDKEALYRGILSECSEKRKVTEVVKAIMGRKDIIEAARAVSTTSLTNEAAESLVRAAKAWQSRQKKRKSKT